MLDCRCQATKTYQSSAEVVTSLSLSLSAATVQITVSFLLFDIISTVFDSSLLTDNCRNPQLTLCSVSAVQKSSHC